MGKCGSKQTAPKTDSNIISIMRKKYGDQCLESLPLWVKYGFPPEGSLSLNQLEHLKTTLKSIKDTQYNNNKNISVKWLRKMDLHERNFHIWHKEALLRLDKQKKNLTNQTDTDPNF